MLADIIAAGSGVISGVASGVAASRLWVRRTVRANELIGTFEPRRELEEIEDEVAYGQGTKPRFPDAEQLIAGKVRLAHALIGRRPRAGPLGTTSVVTVFWETVVSIALALAAGVAVYAAAAAVTASVRIRRPGGVSIRTQVRLHGIRRSLDLVQLKSAVRRDGNRLRRELHAELPTSSNNKPRPGG